MAMQDGMLMAAGVLGMIIAVAHGYLGTAKVVGPLQVEPEAVKRILKAIMFLSAVYWFLAGLALVAAPSSFEDEGRTLAAYIAAAMYLSGAAGNCWATRGRHFGWVLLTLAGTLAVVGA